MTAQDKDDPAGRPAFGSGRPTVESDHWRSLQVTVPQPVGQIHPPPWMTAPESRAVLDALSARGHEVRFIGGCVRDAILNRPPGDIDLALAPAPHQVIDLLGAAGVRAIPTGIDHGTVTAVVGPMHFEITTLRIDVETDGRRARVAFTDDWQADAARRDFTINALSATTDGAIYDYFGGLEDLGHGIIRFVGEPEARISEDALRLLRFFRFYAHFGRPPADGAALDACRARAAAVTALSGERVRGEILRTLMAADPADVFELMANVGVLGHVLPEAGQPERLRLLSWLETRALRLDTVTPDGTRRLAALLATNREGALAVAERLRFSNRERDRLVLAAAPPVVVDPEAEDADIARFLHRLGAEAMRDIALITWAGERLLMPRLSPDRTRAWIGLIERIDAWQPTPFPLKGRDALALGIARGPRIGQVLGQVQSWWEADGCRASREDCLDRLRAIVNSGPA
jgi:poly(A) polymerase